MIHQSKITGFETVVHEADLCIVGAGAAGMFAAVAAARNGAKVAVMHDRPVVGGNSSGEIRMWIRGAHGRDNKESGLVEELAMANLRRNPTLNFSIWDSVTYEMMKNEPNIDLILNCSCLDAEMNGNCAAGNHIASIRGWQTTTQKFHQIKAKIFADCSGDSVLAPLTGAEFRMGREARAEFNEDISPEVSDNCTMGMSCLFQVRELDREVPFIAPDWAEKFTDETIGHRVNINKPETFKIDNFWWMELGGMYDSIGDTEVLRDRLLAIAFGVWDYFKNSGRYDSKNWELDWVGFLPGKRESRRYVGDYILNQNDVRTEGRFEDIVAYGGWTMDDHHPAGFDTTASPNKFHPAPSPFGIPYRTMYSKNIENLMFAGRNISCTHAAMSACRVMATCGTIGQAMGTAAAIAVAHNTTPRGVYEHYLTELKQTLMIDDCYLPFNFRCLTPAMEGISAKVGERDAAVVYDGFDRTVKGNSHLLAFAFGEELEITLPAVRTLKEIRFTFDSDINRDTYKGFVPTHKTYPMRCNRWLNEPFYGIPDTLMRDFDVLINDGTGWQKLACVMNNYRRQWKYVGEVNAKAIKLVPKCAYGADTARVYSVILK